MGSNGGLETARGGTLGEKVPTAGDATAPPTGSNSDPGPLQVSAAASDRACALHTQLLRERARADSEAVQAARIATSAAQELRIAKEHIADLEAEISRLEHEQRMDGEVVAVKLHELSHARDLERMRRVAVEEEMQSLRRDNEQLKALLEAHRSRKEKAEAVTAPVGPPGPRRSGATPTLTRLIQSPVALVSVPKEENGVHRAVPGHRHTRELAAAPQGGDVAVARLRGLLGQAVVEQGMASKRFAETLASLHDRHASGTSCRRSEGCNGNGTRCDGGTRTSNPFPASASSVAVIFAVNGNDEGGTE